MDIVKYGQVMVQHPWKVILGCLMLIIGISYFMKDVAPSISYKDMLGADYPLLIDYEKVQREFTSDDNLLVLIEAKDGDVFTQEIIGAVSSLTEKLWQTPYSIRVDSITNFQHTVAIGDDLFVDNLVPENQSLERNFLERLRKIALSEPQLLNRAVNQAGSVAVISVTFSFPNKDLNEKLQANAFVEKLVSEFAIREQSTRTYIAGLVALDATVMQLSQKESGIFLILIIFIVAVLMAFVFKTIKPMLISVFIIVASVVAGMAFSGIMGWKLTPFTASVPLMILVLAAADCIHFISNVMEKVNSGDSQNSAIVEAFCLNFSPIAITSITTAIGFLTLNFSESESIGALGSQVAFGVIVAFILSVTFLPAVLSLIKLRQKDKSKIKKMVFAKRLAQRVNRNKNVLVFSSILIFIGVGLGISKNEFNDNIPTYFSKSLSWRQANDFAEKEFGGAYTFAFVLESRRENGITDVSYLNKLEKFSSWLRDNPNVASVSSFADNIKRINKSMHGDNQSFYKLPEDRELISQYLLLYEMSLPYGLGLDNQLNFNKSASKVTATFKTLSTSQILQLEKDIHEWAKLNLADVEFKMTGVQLMFAHLLNQDTRGLVIGAVLGLVLISLLLIGAFSSLKIGLLSLIPNLAPVLAAFGIWGILVSQVGMGMAMVAGITIGVVVDDTVHFMYKYLYARRTLSRSSLDAVEYAYHHAGKAIVITTFTLFVGFSMLVVLSEFRVNSDLGKMACIVMSLALIIDLLVLPALLMIVDNKITLARSSKPPRMLPEMK